MRSSRRRSFPSLTEWRTDSRCSCCRGFCLSLLLSRPVLGQGHTFRQFAGQSHAQEKGSPGLFHGRGGQGRKSRKKLFAVSGAGPRGFRTGIWINRDSDCFFRKSLLIFPLAWSFRRKVNFPSGTGVFSWSKVERMVRSFHFNLKCTDNDNHPGFILAHPIGFGAGSCFCGSLLLPHESPG